MRGLHLVVALVVAVAGVSPGDDVLAGVDSPELEAGGNSPAAGSEGAEDEGGADGGIRPNIIPGSRTMTAEPNGVWRSHFNAWGSRTVVADGKSIWFGTSDEPLWRYDVASRKIDAWSSPLAQSGLRQYPLPDLAPDGSLATGSHIWKPGEGWRCPPLGMEAGKVAFSAESDLHIFGQRNIYRQQGGRWVPIQTADYSSLLLVRWTDDGWFTYKRGRKDPFAWYAADFCERRELELPEKLTFSEYSPMLRVNNSLYGVFRSADRSQVHVLKIGRDGFQKIAEGEVAGLCLKSGVGFRMVLKESGAGAIVEGEREVTQISPALPPTVAANGLLMLRDANGDYWVSCWRWNGRRWETVLPPGAFHAQSMLPLLSSQWLVYDRERDQWRMRGDELGELWGYDARLRQAWIIVRPGAGQKDRLVLYQLAEDGKHQELAKLDEVPGWSPFRDRGGNWWFLRAPGRPSFWDGRRVHNPTVPAAPAGGLRGLGNVLALSPKGRVWLHRENHTSLRYDERTNAFVQEEPYEDFAFEIGGRRLAAIWSTNRGSGHDNERGLVYEHGPSGWRKLENPFYPAGINTEGTSVDRCMFADRQGAVHNGRILLTTDLGVFEWDVAADRWAYLVSGSRLWARYDQEGRRMIMPAGKRRILVYEGEPIGAAIVVGEAPQFHFPVAEMERLFVLMDDVALRVRNEATASAIELSKKHPRWATEYLAKARKRDDLEAEVQYRAGLVLKALEEMGKQAEGRVESVVPSVAAWRATGNSLLDRMSSPQVAMERLVIKAGATNREAQAMLRLAGADLIQSSVTGGLSISSWLLPDGRRVFLRTVEMPDGEPVVPSIVVSADGVRRASDRPEVGDKDEVQELELEPERRVHWR